MSPDEEIQTIFFDIDYSGADVPSTSSTLLASEDASRVTVGFRKPFIDEGGEAAKEGRMYNDLPVRKGIQIRGGTCVHRYPSEPSLQTALIGSEEKQRTCNSPMHSLSSSASSFFSFSPSSSSSLRALQFSTESFSVQTDSDLVASLRRVASLASSATNNKELIAGRSPVRPTSKFVLPSQPPLSLSLSLYICINISISIYVSICVSVHFI